MTVLAYRVKNGPQKVPTLTPNYKAAKYFALGKDITPDPFNTNTELQEGIHLHFILPSALKHGKTTSDGKNFEYPHVPDKYIVTRMYPSIDNEGNKKIIHDCFIVDSSFYSTKKYGNNITIPFTEDNKSRSYRYLGRQYNINDNIPEPKNENGEGHRDDLFAIGPGDPLFNAYYPSCRSVFGFYDNLENVPEDAVLTYSVIGYYSNEEKDDIAKILKEYDEKDGKEENIEQKLNSLKKKCRLTVKQASYSEEDSPNSTLLFGEVCNIDLSKKVPLPTGEINTGIGRTSAEALSAIIAKKYSAEELERTLTMLQYDLDKELSQVDGNFKIDDNIHSYGFATIDSIEKQFEITIDKKNDKISKEILSKTLSAIQSDYNKLCKKQRKLGKLRRKLEYKKRALYYLWEMYKDLGKTESESSQTTRNTIDKTKNKINNIRNKIAIIENIDLKKQIQDKIDENKLTEIIKLEKVSTKPFYIPKDPALMLFGSGLKRTYAFGEDGRFEKDNTLSCLNSPLLSKKDDKIINSIIINENLENRIDYKRYLNFLVMTVLLDDKNLLPAISPPDAPISINDDREPSPVMVNKNPDDEVMLFMEWETQFHNDYVNSNASHSTLNYGDTDFSYNGKKTKNDRWCIGNSVLTPHGICNLEDKIKKYAEEHQNSDSSNNENEELKKLADQIKDIPALSQNLGGFTINLASLKSVFQKPIEGTDKTTQDVINCLNNNSNDELDIERLAVIEDSDVLPLREGFLDIKNLSIVSSFGNTRKIVEDKQLLSKKKHYISECLYSTPSDKNGDIECFLPLALTSPVRMTPYFVSAANSSIRSNSLPGTTPIIAIIMPDILNSNLDIFSNKGDLIGVIKTVYRDNKAKGRFAQICNETTLIDDRLRTFIDSLTIDNVTDEKSFSDNCSRLSELMKIIEFKLNNTLSMNQNDFIFGRALVLAEMDIELEYHGGTEFSKKIYDSENPLKDNGLSKQDFEVKIGDINRVTDGVICGFYEDKEDNKDKGVKCFATYGHEIGENQYFKDDFPKISGKKTAKVTLLFDPSLKITLTTGFLPVEQIQVNAAHTDFSGMNLMLAEMNTLITEENRVQLPDFMKMEKFARKYSSKRYENKIEYENIFVEKAESSIGLIGKTMFNDGFIAKIMNEASAEFPKYIFYSNKKNFIKTNDFYFKFFVSGYPQRKDSNEQKKPKICILGLEHLFIDDGTIEKTMTNFAEAFDTNGQKDWNITYGESPYGKCLIVTCEATEIREFLSIKFSLSHNYEFTAPFKDNDTIAITVHFDDFDLLYSDFDNTIERNYTVTVREMPCIEEYTVIDSNRIR